MCNSLLLPLFVHVQLPTFTFVHIQLPTSAFVHAQVPSFCYRLLVHVHIPSGFVCTCTTPLCLPLYMYKSLTSAFVCRCTTSSFCVCTTRLLLLLLHLCIYTPLFLSLWMYIFLTSAFVHIQPRLFVCVQLPYFCLCASTTPLFLCLFTCTSPSPLPLFVRIQGLLALSFFAHPQHPGPFWRIE